MLLAGEQFDAPYVAILMAVPVSWLAPDWIARSAASDSLTPPAHDSMSVFMSCTNPRRSAARWAADGRCGRAASTRPAASTAAAASNQRGPRRAGHPDGRSGARPGPAASARADPVMPASPSVLPWASSRWGLVNTFLVPISVHIRSRADPGISNRMRDARQSQAPCRPQAIRPGGRTANGLAFRRLAAGCPAVTRRDALGTVTYITRGLFWSA